MRQGIQPAGRKLLKGCPKLLKGWWLNPGDFQLVVHHIRGNIIRVHRLTKKIQKVDNTDMDRSTTVACCNGCLLIYLTAKSKNKRLSGCATGMLQPAVKRHPVCCLAQASKASTLLKKHFSLVFSASLMFGGSLCVYPRSFCPVLNIQKHPRASIAPTPHLSSREACDIESCVGSLKNSSALQELGVLVQKETQPQNTSKLALARLP